MSWKIVPVNRICHLTPSLAVGTASTDAPPFNVSTLDPNIVANVSHAVASYAEWRWDRGVGALNNANCAAIINHNLASRDCTWTLYGGASAGATTTTLVATTTPTTNADSFAAFAAPSTHRHLTLRVANKYGSAGSNIRLGVFVVGFYYDLGGHPLGNGSTSIYTNSGDLQYSLIGVPHSPGYSEGGRVVSRDFSIVTHSNAEEIARLASRQWDGTTDTDTTDGVGGGGGKNNIVVVDDDGRVFYGPTNVSIVQIAPAYDRLSIIVQTVPHWGLE